MAHVKDSGIAENFFRREGRLNRWRYFKRSITIALVSFIIVLGIIVMDVNALGQLSSFGNGLIKIFSAAVQVPIFCLTVRRLHDMNKDETLAYVCVTLSLSTIIFQGNDFLVTEPSQLENILTMINGIIALYILFCPGTKGDNQYGTDPLE